MSQIIWAIGFFLFYIFVQYEGLKKKNQLNTPTRMNNNVLRKKKIHGNVHWRDTRVAKLY